MPSVDLLNGHRLKQGLLDSTEFSPGIHESWGIGCLMAIAKNEIEGAS
jgi:hypothetical protein